MKEKEERKIREEEERKMKEEEERKRAVTFSNEEWNQLGIFKRMGLNKEEFIKTKSEEYFQKEEEEEEGVQNPQVGLMNSIQDLLKEVNSQLGDLSDEEEDIYFKIKNDMRQDQDDETMRVYEEELRKILNK